MQNSIEGNSGVFVPRLRLRTRFLLAMLLITAGLTVTSLLLVRRTVEQNVRQNIVVNLQNSVAAFQDYRQQRETMLTGDVALLADLPITRNIMSISDPVTIQDASQDVSDIADNDLFALFNREGKILALHTKTRGFSREDAEKYFQQSLEDHNASSHWWFGEHHLYQTFIQPVYRGSRTDGTMLGFLVIGYEIDHRLAAVVSKVAGSHVAISCGSEIISSTLRQDQLTVDNVRPLTDGSAQAEPHDIEIGTERYLATSIELSNSSRVAPVRLTVLASYDPITKFLDQLNRYILLLGLAAIVIGSALVFFVSHTFTRPLENLVGGVRALGAGDFYHPLDSRGGDEVAELTRAFDRMRASLLKSQQDLLESEQLATIGRMASSISHDLRHSLAAIVANSEFLVETHLTPAQREELYQEVRSGVNLMTDLIDSLLEFARTRESLNPTYSLVSETIQRALQAVRLHPRYSERRITVSYDAHLAGWFDQRKLERALYNLLLNACDAAPAVGGTIEVTAAEISGAIAISVADNGPGIADSIRDRIFHPFVSFGKENGTGLGLAVVQKIVQDHGGEVSVERSGEGRTVFRMVLPSRVSQSSGELPETNGNAPLVSAQRLESSQNLLSHPGS